jgi:hypothetical protein
MAKNEPERPNPMWTFQREHIPSMVIAIVVVVLGVIGLGSSGVNYVISIAAIIVGSVYAGVLLNQPPAKYLKPRKKK